MLGMIRDGATHIAVATDHVIESFRNELWPGYKTSEGVEPDLLAQFPLLEEVLSAAGVVVWPMVEFEADDALAAAAVAAARDARVERVIICTPDKDLAQCVRGTRIVQLNRRTRVTLDEAGVIQKFGVSPASIPDYLALVGDAADGYPGLPGWGAKSSAAVLAKFRPSRIHSHGLPRVARERRQRECPRRHSLPRAGARTAVSNARHSPDRHRALRRRGPVALEWPHTGLRLSRRSIGRSTYGKAAASDQSGRDQVDAPTQSASISGKVIVSELFACFGGRKSC